LSFYLNNGKAFVLGKTCKAIRFFLYRNSAEVQNLSTFPVQKASDCICNYIYSNKLQKQQAHLKRKIKWEITSENILKETGRSANISPYLKDPLTHWPLWFPLALQYIYQCVTGADSW